MIIFLNLKNLNQSLSMDEIKIVNTIISKIDYKDLQTILKNRYSELELKKIVYQLYQKGMITTDNPDFFKQKDDADIEKLKSLIDLTFNKIKAKQNYYIIFEILPDTPQAEIKSKYFELSKKYHPDVIHKYNLDFQYMRKVEEITITISNIYNTLRFPEKRKLYDEKIGLNSNKKQFLSREEQEKIDKAKEFYILALNEFHNYNYTKSENLLKMALSFNSKDEKSLILKRDLQKQFENQEKINILKEIDKAIQNREFEEGLKLIDRAIQIDEKSRLYVKRAELLQKADKNKFQEKIIQNFQKALELEPRKMDIYETFLNFLKDVEREDLFNKISEEALKIDPENKSIKRLKKRSIWNIFSVSI
ncbi:DnaJ domain-containing protein [bacterium]|nr:DnaJ domain-containing protein [bacterium]